MVEGVVELGVVVVVVAVVVVVEVVEVVEVVSMVLSMEKSNMSMCESDPNL